MQKPYSFLSANLCEIDADSFRIIEFEKRRQERKLIMIASESMCPKAVLEAQASVFSHLYAEGYPSLKMAIKEGEQILDFEKQLLAQKIEGDLRYYKGCDYANFIEALAQWRAAQLFAHKDNTVDIKSQDILVNVQPLSGAAANNAVFHALVEPGQTIMGMSLSHGGHLSHGSKVNRSGKLYKPVQYKVDMTTGRLDYEQLRQLALQNKPKMIIAGASAYPWDLDWKTLRAIADEVGAYLLADISHPSGLVVAGLFSNPLGYAHATTTTTHKTLCGPRAAIIMSTDKEIAAKIDKAVFPGEQGGPHINTIAGLAVAFKLAATPEFKDLMKRVVQNCVALSDGLSKRGFKIAGGGTSTHLCLVDLKSVPGASGIPIKGEVASSLLDLCGLTCNRNTIPGDATSADASAIRLGTTWLTQLGMGTTEMDRIATLIHKVVTTTHTYTVESKTGSTVRGRLPFDTLMWARQEVAKLLHSRDYPEYPKYPHYYAPVTQSQTPREYFHFGKTVKLQSTGAISLVQAIDDESKEKQALQQNAVLVHPVENGILEITGHKAVGFISDVVTCQVWDLAEGHGRRGFVLDPQGEIIADVHIWRMSDDDKEKSPRFWLVTTPKARESLKEWLRSLADGIVLCDSDAATQVAGPVLVRDLYEMKPGWSMLMLAGPQASKIVGRLETELASLLPFTWKKITWEQTPAIVARAGFAADQSVFDIYLPHEQVPAMVKKLQILAEGPLVPAGQAAVEQLRQAVGLPAAGDSTPLQATAAFAKFPTYFASGKPFFVGYQALQVQYTKSTKERHSYQLYQGEPRYTCLAEEHKKLTKRSLTPFAGWWMPILYSSILEEHKVVRETAALFDVTHMGVFEVAGKGAARFLDLVSPNDVEKLNIGQSHYSFLLTPEGSAIDDMTVYRRDKDKYMLVINAANAEKDLAWLMAVLHKQVAIDFDLPGREVDVAPALRDLKAAEAGKDRKVDIALQGPKSLAIMQALAGNDEKLQQKLANLRKWHFIEATLVGIPMIICRSGYTGEAWGFEVYLHPDQAAAFWNVLLDKGQPFGIKPTGLGARDSTRTEAGFPLYGHELAGPWDMTPLEAGYSSFVKYDKPFFIGKKALMAKDQASKMRVARFEMEATQIRAVRPGAVVVNRQGQVIGLVTSCAYVGVKQIGMAYVAKEYVAEGTKLGIINLPQNRNAPQPKALAELQLGDTIPLPESAIVLPRFAMRS